MIRKKRTFKSSELMKSIAKIYGFENKILAFEVKDFLKSYIASALFEEIDRINIENKTLILKIKSPLLKNDFRLQKSFLLKKIQEQFGEENINALSIL